MAWVSVVWFFIAAWSCFAGGSNLFYLRRTPKADPRRRTWPRVSILVPARNEAHRMGLLLESLAYQDYPRYEVLVLDDESSDGTSDLVRHYAEKNRRIRVLRGRPLPKGWRGKNWACHQASQRAKGEWLLFLDADTWFDTDMLKRTVTAVEREKLDALSLLTRQVTRSWLEALVVPVMVFNFLMAFPAAWVYRVGSPFARLAGFSGQFIMIAKESYRALGGHEAVKGEIVEDLRLGSLAVLGGLKIRMGDGTDLGSTRMYNRAAEVWEGFTKNFYPALHFSIPRFTVMVGALLLVDVAPFFVLWGGPGLGPLFWSALVLATVRIAFRWAHSARYGFSFASIPFHPLGAVLFTLIGFNSLRVYMTGKGGLWKGRVLKGR